MLQIEGGSTRSHSVKNSLWKKIWTSHKADYRMDAVNCFGYWVVGDEWNMNR